MLYTYDFYLTVLWYSKGIKMKVPLHIKIGISYFKMKTNTNNGGTCYCTPLVYFGDLQFRSPFHSF
jgi:hypothetical protein